MALSWLFIIVTFVIHQCLAEGWFENGHEYHYSYSAYTISGVEEPASYGSSVNITGNLVIQQSGGLAVVKLSDIVLTIHNGPNALLSSLKYQKSRYELAPLEKAFKISFTNGKINGLNAESSDPDWSINIKKALATMLQVDMATGENFGKGENAYIRSIEDTISGMCNTSYSFGTGERGRLLLIKQRSQNECINSAPRVFFNTMDAISCAGKRLEEVTSSTTTQTVYQFAHHTNNNTLKAYLISSIGYQYFQFHPPSGTPFYNLANTTLVLKSSGPISRPITTGSLTKVYGSLRYVVKRSIPSSDEVDLTREEDFFHPEDPPLSQSVIRTKVLGLFNKLKETMASLPFEDDKNQDPSTGLMLIQLFSSMNLESLRSLYSSVEKQEDLRNLYVQLLPLSGSNPAALRIKEMIIDGKVNNIEAQRIITLLPFHLKLPTEKLLTSYENLLANNDNIKSKELKESIAMAFMHLVSVTCNPSRPRPCRLDNLKKYGRMAYESFSNARGHPEMMVTLLALRNTKQPALIEKLVPLASSGASSHALRPNIIYALQDISQTHRKQFLAAILPILLNTTETNEMRIAAAVSFFQSGPSFFELEQLTSSISLWEKNQQVRNFILTRMKDIAADSNNPCVKILGAQMQMLMRRLSHISINPYASSSRTFNFYDDKYSIGGGIRILSVLGEESRIPLIISARFTQRAGEYSYAPVEVFLRIEGIDEAFLRPFRQLDPVDFKIDVLKNLLHDTMQIQPRFQAPLKMELIVKYQGYYVMYKYMDANNIAELMDPKNLGGLFMSSSGLKLSQTTIHLTGQYSSWKTNDMGIPVGIGMSNFGFSKFLMTGRGPQIRSPTNMASSVIANYDWTQQVVNYMGFHFIPLASSHGIFKITGSRTHLPIDLNIGLSPAERQIEFKLNIPNKDKPLAFNFGSKTVANIWGSNDDAISKAVGYMKTNCPDCSQIALVSRGKKFLKDIVLRENKNTILGMESQFKLYSCETDNGKASIAKIVKAMMDFNNNDIPSDERSLLGSIITTIFKVRAHLEQYPTTDSCFSKFVVHKTAQHPSDIIEIKLKLDSNVPIGFRAVPGKEFRNIFGSLSLLGAKERKWNIQVNIETEPSNVRSLVNVKIARQPNTALGLKARALCASIKTEWSSLPLDIMETPSFVEPSIKRNVTLVWGEAPINECPDENEKDVATMTVGMVGTITQAQRDAAFQRYPYPYNQCDKDRKEAGRSGVAVPLTEACYEAVMQYATPRSYVFDIHYENIPPEGTKVLKGLEAIVRAFLMPYWNGSSSTTSLKAGHIQLKAEFGEEDVDLLHVNTEFMKSHYENVDILRDTRELLRNARFDLDQLKTGWIGICNAAPKAVSTFDDITIPYDLPNCYTLISADCFSIPRFAVLARKSGKTLPLAVKIYIGGNSVELVPIGSGAVQVKTNDQIVTLEQGRVHLFGERSHNHEYYVEVEKVMTNKYFIRAPLLNLVFRYTGDDVTSFVPASFRAQHCGLCGNFNGQYSRGLVDPSGCTVNNGTELARAYILRDKDCKDSVPVPVCNNRPPSPRQFNPEFDGLANNILANLRATWLTN